MISSILSMCFSELEQWDYEQCVDVAVHMLLLLEEQINVIIIMSDEAQFDPNGVLNKHNLAIGSPTILKSLTRNLYTYRM